MVKYKKADKEVNQKSTGYIKDYITGKNIRSTPEEIQAVQVFVKQLVEDYKYPKSHIQTHPQYRVKARPSDTKKEYPVDIAIFNSDVKNENTIQIIVECKKKTRKDGKSQLKDYLRFSKAKLGVWFNGEERLFLKKIEKDGEVLFDEIPNIPKHGQRFEDIGLFKRCDLGTPHNLKVIFTAIRNHLAGNTVGATRDEILAQQMINIIFCKIYDERFTEKNDIVTFRAGVDESKTEIRDRIIELFERVKSKYSEVIDVSDTIILDERTITYIVGEMQNYCLINAERDVIADAFEIFIGKALKGDQGQFFTPRNIIKVMVNIINPEPNELLIDPACGSGGFLIESLRHMWKKLDLQSEKYNWSKLALTEEKMATAIKNIRGIDKDDFLSKVAKAYMAIIGDGKGGIFCDDSLERISEWNQNTKQNIQFGKFDVLLTNPPFGKDIKVVGEEKLEQYDLAYGWKKKDNSFIKTNKLKTEQTPQILFIERSLQLLKDGGRMGIVLPETFFHAPRSKFVFEYLRRNNNITWLIDLPHNTFRPHNNAKCIAIILEKNCPQLSKINMAVAEEMGHDHNGNIIYKWNPKTNTIDVNSIWDDIPFIIEEAKSGSFNKFCFKVENNTVDDFGILVPRYYWQNKLTEVREISTKENMDLVSITNLIENNILGFFDGHGSPPAQYKGKGNVPYIRVKDIVNWEIYKDPTAKIPTSIYKSMKGSKKNLHTNDVVYVRRGSYRIGSVAMVSPFDTDILLTREILVLRVLNNINRFGLDPFYLLYLLSHRLVQLQSFNKILIETTLPNIGDRWQELYLPIHKDKKVRENISQRINQVITAKWKAVKQIESIKQELGDIRT